MAITGNLIDFSLPEIFQFLDQGHKTGLLKVRSLPNAEQPKSKYYYIWLQQGRVVAAADRTDGQGLIQILNQRGWVADKFITKVGEICDLEAPVGLCLKNKGLLTSEHLKLLFSIQVLRQICALFQLEGGQFKFEANAVLPKGEMTGLSLPAMETTLMGLRALKNWTNLELKLPDETSALLSSVRGQPAFRLDTLEWQVWEYANGTASLKTIAEQLRLTLEKVRQIAFRLSVVGLVEEVPMFFGESSASNITEENQDLSANDLSSVNAAKPAVSSNFLKGLVGFLQNRV